MPAGIDGRRNIQRNFDEPACGSRRNTSIEREPGLETKPLFRPRLDCKRSREIHGVVRVIHRDGRRRLGRGIVSCLGPEFLELQRNGLARLIQLAADDHDLPGDRIVLREDFVVQIHRDLRARDIERAFEGFD